VEHNEVKGAGSCGGGAIGAGAMVRTSVRHNRSPGAGGGLCVEFGSQIVNSTVAENRTGGNGGGIHVRGYAELRNVTVALNRSGEFNPFPFNGRGGGIYAFNGMLLGMANSIVAANVSAGIGGRDDCSGSILSRGYNLVGEPQGCLLTGSGGSDQIGVDPILQPGGNYGGSVVGADNATVFADMVTYPPSGVSPALDRGDPSGCKDADGALIPTDQRGRPRRVDGPDFDRIPACDVGAVERQP
jgi:hypothetical protein